MTIKKSGGVVLENRKARHEYHLEDQLDAGLVLEGWEVKSIRAGKVSLAESFVQIQGGEAFWLQAHITPLVSASTHVHCDATRPRKLLLNKKEISRLIGSVERQGYTLIPLKLFWLKGNLKLGVALAKGKQLHDKRADEKARDWDREKARVLKQG